MKKFTTVLLVLIVGGLANSLFAQFDDYIDEIRGDTAIVKSYADMDYVANSLIDAIASDTLANGDRANPNRVYMLKRGRFYPQDRGFSYPDVPMMVMGEEGPLVGGTEEDGALPVIHGTTNATGGAQNGGMIGLKNDATFKNLTAETAADNGSQGWANVAIQDSGIQVTFDNCMFEHTNWVIAQSNNFSDLKLHIENCYFVNMSGFPCRRNGGVYDNVNFNTAEMYVENSTHVMAAGMLYKFRNYPIYHAYFNHNTFLNCTGNVFETFGYQVEWVVTNNLFVNSNCQAYYPGLDVAETDQDSLPTGIINVNVLSGMDTWYPDGFAEEDRKILVDRNAVYWDSRLDEIITTLTANTDTVEWFSQMFTMNSRSQEMFDDATNYPLLNEGNWIEGEEPGFNDMDDQVPNIITYCIDVVAADNNTNLPKWRAEGNEITDDNKDNMVYPDWPLNCDLRYSNTTLRSAGLSGFPVGDLNWFGYLKSTWDDQSEAEHTAIIAALNSGTSPEEQDVVIPPEFVGVESLEATNFELKNYPNPFASNTTISYELPANGKVLLKVHDIQGREVTTLVNQEQGAGTYSVEFSAENLAHGIYFYSLSVNDMKETRRMIIK